MPIDEASVRRVYRHRPWLIVVSVTAIFTAGCIAAVVDFAVRAPSIDRVARAILFLVPLVAFELFLMLSFRVRTVVDATGITQHWILRSFHVPYEELSRMEPVHTGIRWYLRLWCGDRSIEAIPCHTYVWSPLPAAPGPPRAMRLVEADIRRRLEDEDGGGGRPAAGHGE